MKKQYALALGGGAARGFIHLGVLQYLEEQNIKITEISGTSMGALVAAFYASGKSLSEIIDFAKKINYFQLVDIDFKQGLLKGKKIYRLLEKEFGDACIENLNIPIQIVATNIETGERKVFTSGSVVDALRASFSLPGILTPHQIDGQLYVDGGITSNLPIDVLKKKNVIGVSALKKMDFPVIQKRKIFGIELRKSFLSFNYQIIHRTIITMMKQNEERSLEKVPGNFMLLSPDFGDLDYYSFDKIDDFVTLGYKEAQKKLGA